MAITRRSLALPIACGARTAPWGSLGGRVGHKAPNSGRARRPKGTARLVRAVFVCALFISALAASSASAATTLTSFSVTREASNPAAVCPIAAVGAGQNPATVCTNPSTSPFGNRLCSAPKNFQTGNPVLPAGPADCTAATCDNNDPVVSPSLHVDAQIGDPATTPLEALTLHLPGGQLGNP